MRTLIGLLLLLPSVVFAAPGLWFEPAREGHGLSISAPTSGGHAVIWYLYREDGSAAFLLGGPCREFPCVTELFEPKARYMGGELDLGPPVGTLEIGEAKGDRMRVDFNLTAWTWPRCKGVSAMGYLWRECAGTITMHRLTP